jgi:hypothetical protein
MNRIKFSHSYKKLRGANLNGVKLLDVLVANLESLSTPFLEYDTDNVYALPKKGKYLMLIFEKNIGDDEFNLFTTLRRYTPEKLIYYNFKVGELFKIEIELGD